MVLAVIGIISGAVMGAFKARALFGVLAVPGVILSAVYMLWALQRILYGKAPEKHAGYPDLTLREKLTLIPLIVLIFWMGIYSPMFTSKMHVSVLDVISKVKISSPFVVKGAPQKEGGAEGDQAALSGRPRATGTSHE